MFEGSECGEFYRQGMRGIVSRGADRSDGRVAVSREGILPDWVAITI